MISGQPTHWYLTIDVDITWLQYAIISEKAKKDVWVRIKDEAGNEFSCPIDALKNREAATAEELDDCVDNAETERYAGNLNSLTLLYYGIYF